MLTLLGASAGAETPPATTTPIQHLIVVVGENLSFDNLFGCYEPRPGAIVHNLLSAGIVNRDGSRGPNFAKPAQRRAEVRETYEVTPRIVGTYGMLSQPAQPTVGLPRNVFLTSASEFLPNGPFQITKYIGYAEPVGDPVHRFFQMWQQVDGGRRDLFVWVAEMSGEGSQNAPIRIQHQPGQSPWASTIWRLATRVYFRESPDTYALSDNHHQPVMGGTGPISGTGNRACHCSLGKRCTGRSRRQPDRKPKSAPWHQQLVHAIGLFERLLHQLLGAE